MKLSELPISSKTGASNEFRTSKRSEGLRTINMRMFGPFLVLVLMLICVGLVSPSALTPKSLASFAVDAAPLLLLVMGSTLPILIGGIDLSAAAMATMSGVSISLLAPHLGSWAVPATISMALLTGAMQGYIHGKYQVPSFAVSLGMLGILSGLALYVTSATALPIDPGFVIFDVLAGATIGVPNSIWIVVAVWLMLTGTMRYLRLGRHVYAIGTAELAATMSGVNALQVRILVFGLSAGCSAVAGTMYVSQTLFSSPTLAQTMLLPAIVGVVLGGTAISGGIGGVGVSLIGGLAAAFLRIGSVVVGLPPTSQDLVYGVVVLLAVAATLDRKKLANVK